MRNASLQRRLLVLTAVALLAACSPNRTLEAVRVLQDIQAGDRPSALKQATPEPKRASMVFTVDGRERLADLYTPTEGGRAGVVLVPGLTPHGREDMRIVAFAYTLARANFEVIVPDLPAMRSLRVTARDAEPIADAAHFMDERGAGRPLGVTSVSFAVGPAVLALDEDAAGRVDFFLAIGGYYDLAALITYVTTGFYRRHDDDLWQYRPPKAYAKWIFMLSNADRLADPKDRATLSEMASRKLANADADVSDLVMALGPEGESVYALVTNGDPDRVTALLDGLPPGIRQEIERLDLRRRDLSRLDTEFLLIHDQGDRAVPATQSFAFAAALAPDRARLYLVEGLDHAQVKTLGAADVLTLLRAIYEYLRLRDTPRQSIADGAIE